MGFEKTFIVCPECRGKGHIFGIRWVLVEFGVYYPEETNRICNLCDGVGSLEKDSDEYQTYILEHKL